MPDHDRRAASAAAWAAGSLVGWLRASLPHRLAERSRVVLSYLATRADWKTGQTDSPVTGGKAGEACGMCERAAYDALEDLAASGWIAEVKRTRAGTIYAVRHPDAPPLCEDARPARRRPAPAPRVPPAEKTSGRAKPGPAKAGGKPVDNLGATVEHVIALYRDRFRAVRGIDAPVGTPERKTLERMVREYGAETTRLAITGAFEDEWGSERVTVALIARDPARWLKPVRPRHPKPVLQGRPPPRPQEPRAASPPDDGPAPWDLPPRPSKDDGDLH